MVLKPCFPEHQQLHVGTGWKYTFSGPTQHLLKQKLQGWATTLDILVDYQVQSLYFTKWQINNLDVYLGMQRD
jgi:hypothetical protein